MGVIYIALPYSTNCWQQLTEDNGYEDVKLQAAVSTRNWWTAGDISGVKALIEVRAVGGSEGGGRDQNHGNGGKYRANMTCGGYLYGTRNAVRREKMEPKVLVKASGL